MDGDSFASAQRSETRPRRVSLLGGEVDLVTPDDVMAFTAAAIAARRTFIVANHNLHSLHLIRSSAEMQQFYATADLIEADSTPLIAWGRLLGWPIGREHRCTYLDWRSQFWTLAARRGWRVFYLGSAPGVADRAAEVLRRQYPGLQLATASGFFDMAPGSPENEAVAANIRSFEPQVLLVGMGMPRQEAWIADNVQGLPPCVVFSVGAAFDYEAGVQKAAPRWTGPLGLEWLFRFACDPGRLFRRYFVEPWTLAAPAFADLRQRHERERQPSRIP